MKNLMIDGKEGFRNIIERDLKIRGLAPFLTADARNRNRLVKQTQTKQHKEEERAE